MWHCLKFTPYIYCWNSGTLSEVGPVCVTSVVGPVYVTSVVGPVCVTSVVASICHNVTLSEVYSIHLPLEQWHTVWSWTSMCHICSWSSICHICSWTSMCHICSCTSMCHICSWTSMSQCDIVWSLHHTSTVGTVAHCLELDQYVSHL